MPHPPMSANAVEGVAPEDILAALGPIPNVAYAASHVYPLSAPAFERTPAAMRPHPSSGFLRLYVHVPFCNYACSFCFYAIAVRKDRDQMERYLSAVEGELTWVAPGTPITQLYVGGGTPTALPPDLLDRLLTSVFRRVHRFGDGVHSVETSPETLTVDHLRVIKKHGVGRVSMGIQSLDDAILEQVQRRHSKEQALAACRLLADSGLITNVDLIYGLPGQTESGFRRGLERVVAAGVQSLTLYNLRVNEATVVSRKLADQERFNLTRLMRWRAFVAETAASLGFVQTRWHTFVKAGSPAQRHERMPSFDAKQVEGFQLGVGMSAHSQLGTSFYRNHRDLNVYVERIERGESPVEETYPLGVADRKTLFIARSLGDGKPLSRDGYQQAFGRAIEDDFEPLLARLRDAGLVAEDPARNLVRRAAGARPDHRGVLPRARAPLAAGAQRHHARTEPPARALRPRVRFRDRWLGEHYRALAGRGEALLYSGKRFDDFAMRRFLDAVLAAPSLRAARGPAPRALEYGTGTGPGACYLAERDFRVQAIDISPDAIALARRIAHSRRLTISFEVASIVTLAGAPGAFDLVLDNHCLHHITDDQDRRRALANVRRLLAPSGLYVLETVVHHEGRDYGRDRYDPGTSIKLVRIDDTDAAFDGAAYEDVIRLDDGWYWGRSIHRRPAELAAELEGAGLRVVYQSAFGGLLLCVPDQAEVPAAWAAEIRQLYRDDPDAEAIRLKHRVAAPPT